MAKNATKIVLGKRPETFTRTVTFPMVEGGEGCVSVEFIYRTRKEHAEFVDSIQAGVEAKARAEVDRYKKLAESKPDEGVPALKQSDLVAYQIEANVSTIMGAVKGWNLDIPFDREAVEQLVDELPAAVSSIVSAYREAIVEGRLGN